MFQMFQAVPGPSPHFPDEIKWNSTIHTWNKTTKWLGKKIKNKPQLSLEFPANIEIILLWPVGGAGATGVTLL